jgi:hypothetical protein
VATKTRRKTTRAAGKPDPPGAELQHADGCPSEREEAYRERTPDGEQVIVSRCLDCPAHRVDPE